MILRLIFFFFFFFNDTATTEIYTLSLHDALPISSSGSPSARSSPKATWGRGSTRIRSSPSRLKEILARFEIHSEGLGGLGAPNVERVFRRVVGRLPGRIRGDVVDVAEVLGEAVPGIADVVEEVRADHVPAEPPAVLVALVEQPARAHADLVDVADFEARVVEARPVRLDRKSVV